MRCIRFSNFSFLKTGFQGTFLPFTSISILYYVFTYGSVVLNFRRVIINKHDKSIVSQADVVVCMYHAALRRQTFNGMSSWRRTHATCVTQLSSPPRVDLSIYKVENPLSTYITRITASRENVR